ncbi:URC4/urg3 family protein [Gordonia sp. L191]|uniref:URC4/urg3 family protein n=1 Tax=Gordonia sp. L191 TaxID=2982699 RepID=UPI0024BFFC6B|nr:URC4/urg3 family protein [Gordonia sp. L191]WHU49281.1 URC4/urg3 family protein [Gordonia sp. L191]
MTAPGGRSSTSPVGTLDGPVAALRSTAEIRRRAGDLLTSARAGRSAHFTVDDSRISTVVEFVSALTRERYPDLDIPFHSRWRHVEAGGIDRRAELDARLGDVGAAERARTHIDLAVVSVLLDAGAGADWYFDEPGAGVRFTRSEGLAVASVHAFFDGVFSGRLDEPLRVDADGLRALDSSRLATAFGVSENRPLVGLEGRLQVLNRLADAMAARPDVFGTGRPGDLFDHLGGGTREIRAHEILTALLDTLAPIWPADNRIDGIALGDCWRHRGVRGAGATDGWMPFHKLSQWLTYSLLEPFASAGVEVGGLEDLTALPEYRNGGLLLDSGVLATVNPDAAQAVWAVGDEFVVEWRALTVALLDELAPLVATELGVPGLPLACVLEGGTWAAGRRYAAQLRGGLPPLTIDSDGTVF